MNFITPIFGYFIILNTPTKTESVIQQPELLDQVTEELRVKHYSMRTEKAYLDRIKRYIWHHGKRYPKDMGAAWVVR